MDVYQQFSIHLSIYEHPSWLYGSAIGIVLQKKKIMQQQVSLGYTDLISFGDIYTRTLPMSSLALAVSGSLRLWRTSKYFKCAVRLNRQQAQRQPLSMSARHHPRKGCPALSAVSWSSNATTEPRMESQRQIIILPTHRLPCSGYSIHGTHISVEDSTGQNQKHHQQIRKEDGIHFPNNATSFPGSKLCLQELHIPTLTVCFWYKT